MTPIELGELLDGWVEDDRVGLVETRAALTVSRLRSANARELALAAARLAWPAEIHDSAGEAISVEDLDDELGPFVGTIRKPAEGADRRILTTNGFAQALDQNTEGVWQVACVRTAFVSGTASFNPWGEGDVFAPSAEMKSPLELVREGSEVRSVPPDVRKWLVRGSVSEALWADRGFQVFLAASVGPLVSSLASEVSRDGSVVFVGPPRLNMPLDGSDLVRHLQLKGYRNLQAAVAWVYEDRATAEQRHALFAAEFARSVTRREKVSAALRAAGRDILEGARLAFQLSQSDLSREAIKAQGDLRKAVADDTSKAADSARTLAGATAVAIATGIALVAARSTATTQPWVLSLVAAVVAVYLVVVAVSGWVHLGLQSELREQWRTRFYRFIPEDDYRAMVLRPARAAELPYHLIGVVALVVSAALAWAAVTEFDREPLSAAADADRTTTEPAKSPSLSPEVPPKAPASTPIQPLGGAG
jgi:hypothetical protein